MDSDRDSLRGHGAAGETDDSPAAVPGPDPADPGHVRPDCVFCRVVTGDHPAAVVAESAHTLAFLDRRPIFPGHTLVVPRRHVETLDDLPDELLAPLFAAARLMSRAVQAGLGAEGSFVAMNNRISQSVPHLHVHVVPRRPKDGLRGFFWPRHPYEDEDEMLAVASRLRAAVRELRTD